MNNVIQIFLVVVLFSSFSFQTESIAGSKRVKKNSIDSYELVNYDKRFDVNDKDLQRKRSHKRRRKIKKPKKGIR